MPQPDFQRGFSPGDFARELLSFIRRFIGGSTVPDAVSDRIVSDRFVSMPLALRMLRIALRAIPFAAACLLLLDVSRYTPFHFSRADHYALLWVFLAGAVVALVSFWAPRLTLGAFLALWDLRIVWLVGYLLLLLVPPLLFEAVFLRRLFDGILLLPLLAAVWMQYRRNVAAPWLARAFPVAFMVMAVVPGFILPPYYQGIAGWTTSITLGDTVTLFGYQLENDAGERIWLTHTIFAPVTQAGRFAFAWESREAEIGPIGPFIMKAYRRAYPWLKAGYMPHQRYLGQLAYASSTYATNLPDHSNFPPERIVRIQKVELTYDRAGKVVRRDVYGDYEVPRP